MVGFGSQVHENYPQPRRVENLDEACSQVLLATELNILNMTSMKQAILDILSASFFKKMNVADVAGEVYSDQPKTVLVGFRGIERASWWTLVNAWRRSGGQAGPNKNISVTVKGP